MGRNDEDQLSHQQSGKKAHINIFYDLGKKVTTHQQFQHFWQKGTHQQFQHFWRKRHISKIFTIWSQEHTSTK